MRTVNASEFKGPVPSLYGRHRDSLTILGDIVAPVDEAWDAAAAWFRGLRPSPPTRLLKAD